MDSRFATISHRRAIIDRKALADQLGGLGARGKAKATRLLKQALSAGRAEIARRLEEKPWQGSETAAAYAFLTDQRSEEHTSELQSLMRISYAVFCMKKHTKQTKKLNQK